MLKVDEDDRTHKRMTEQLSTNNAVTPDLSLTSMIHSNQFFQYYYYGYHEENET